MTKVADWWDDNRARTETALDQFVVENPNQFGFIVATAIHTAMVVGSGTVDVLRLGDGVVKDGWRGAGTDGLRLLGVLGPVGKVAQIAKLARAINSTKAVIQDVGGGRCAWVAATRAMAATGQKVGGKIFIRVEDLVGATGIPWPTTANGVANLGAFAHTLSTIGAKIGPIRALNSLQGLKSILRSDGSVVMVGIQFLRHGRPEGHAIIAFYDYARRVRYLDRTGNVFNSIEELMVPYGGVTKINIVAGVVFENVYPKFLVAGTATLALEVQAVTISEKK